MIEDTRRPDGEPESDEPIFRIDEPAPPQTEPVLPADTEPESFQDTASDPPADEWRADSEAAFGEPVFGQDDPYPEQTEPEFSTVPKPEPSADSETDFSTDSEPNFPPETGPYPSLDVEIEPGADEPVFAADGEPAELPSPAPYQESHDSSGESFLTDAPAFEMVSGGALEEESVVEEFEEQTFATSQPPQETEWANIAPDADSTAEPLPEKEYALFDETPAADVAARSAPRRRLGRTGPVWVIGGIVLVVIAGLVWLAISRLTGQPNDSSQAVSEPTVQQVEAVAPTPASPTATTGPTPTTAPVRLPIGANVMVADTDGQGVNLREEPGRFGTFVTVLAEGTVLAVLPAEPEDEEYPAVADGHLWYRMRVIAEEGEEPLQGWSASDFFVVVEQ